MTLARCDHCDADLYHQRDSISLYWCKVCITVDNLLLINSGVGNIPRLPFDGDSFSWSKPSNLECLRSIPKKAKLEPVESVPEPVVDYIPETVVENKKFCKRAYYGTGLCSCGKCRYGRFALLNTDAFGYKSQKVG